MIKESATFLKETKFRDEWAYERTNDIYGAIFLANESTFFFAI